MSRIVFLSYWGLVLFILDGSVTEEDLNRGYYYLDCSRKHALSWVTPEIQSGYIPQDRRTQIHTIVRTTLLSAERQGRIIGWGNADKRSLDPRTYARLNEFLWDEGYDEVPNLEGEKDFLPSLVLVRASFSNHKLTFKIT